MKRLSTVWISCLIIIVAGLVYSPQSAAANLDPEYSCTLGADFDTPWVCEEEKPAGYRSCGRCEWNCTDYSVEADLQCPDLWLGWDACSLLPACEEMDAEECEIEEPLFCGSGSRPCHCQLGTSEYTTGCIWVPEEETCEDNVDVCTAYAEEFPLYCVPGNISSPKQ